MEGEGSNVRVSEGLTFLNEKLDNFLSTEGIFF